MFLRIFNSKSVYSVILIPLVAFLFWMEPLKQPVALPPLQGEGMMPLFVFWSSYYVGHPLASVLTGFILLLLNAIVISLLSYEFQFLPHRTFLPGVLYVSIISSFPSLQTFHPVYPATLFVLLSVYYIFLTYHRKREISSTFNASFFLSVAALFYLPVVTMIPLIWISIFVLQKNDNWRLLVIPLIGFTIPWLFLWSFLYVTNGDKAAYTAVVEGLKVVNNQFIFKIAFLIVTGFIFVLSALGSLSLINSVSIRRMSTRKYFIIIYWMLGLSIPSTFIFSSTGLAIIAVLTIPVSYLMTHFFMTGKKFFWKEVLFLLFATALIASHLVLYD
ncbi:MAG: DUF6427 family protein [Marinilabiliales bacterium]|nr:DUF6427 family protein [Marinilabiliales bacterium]